MNGTDYIASLGLSPQLAGKCLLKMTEKAKRDERGLSPLNDLHFVGRGTRVYVTTGRVMELAEVEFYDHVWLEARKMLDIGLANVGGENYKWWFSSSDHTKAAMSKTSKARRVFSTISLGLVASNGRLREAAVRKNLKKMIAQADLGWMVEIDQSPGTLASAYDNEQRNMKLGGYNRYGAVHVAGFVVHEMGHNINLVDVCADCNAPQIATANFYRKAIGVSCRKHSAPPQYIGSARCVELARTHKNLTAWNTDSYRWYCSSFFATKVTAEAVAANLDPAEVAAMARRLNRKDEPVAQPVAHA